MLISRTESKLQQAAAELQGKHGVQVGHEADAFRSRCKKQHVPTNAAALPAASPCPQMCERVLPRSPLLASRSSMWRQICARRAPRPLPRLAPRWRAWRQVGGCFAMEGWMVCEAHFLLKMWKTLWKPELRAKRLSLLLAELACCGTAGRPCHPSQAHSTAKQSCHPLPLCRWASW